MKKSLKTFKDKLVEKEEILKAFQITHPHLTHLNESQILAYFDITTLLELKPYLKEIILSDITPSNEETQPCVCTDSRGQPKELYATEEFAQKEADRLAPLNKVKLNIYTCSNGAGWHLSKI